MSELVSGLTGVAATFALYGVYYIFKERRRQRGAAPRQEHFSVTGAARIPLEYEDHVGMPLTQGLMLKAHQVSFTGHPYEYLEHGGALHSAEVLGLDPFSVVKTLVMQDQDAKPLLVLMHGNRKVSTKNLARQIGSKSVEPCTPEVAHRHSGYLVGGTSPFGTRRDMPVYIEETILALPRIAINGGRRGFLVQIDPQVCVQLLGAQPVHCALAD